MISITYNTHFPTLSAHQLAENGKKKVIIGMSGGVDSSVSAFILQQQGYQVEGLFMKNWEEDDDTDYCTAAADLADAQAVADKLGMKLHKINFAAEYWDNVFEHFLSEYKAGRTPNPDILCNKEIKFKAFLEYATEDLGADYIATGHYVRRSGDDQNAQLLRGLDPNKDQSYFLYALNKNQVGKTLFPVGDIEKPIVRKIADELGLATAKKKDSTGICFIGERKFKDFLARYLPAQPGEIKTVDGKVVGRHDGLMYHTLGQRKGLGIGGVKGLSEEPFYVVEKDLINNVLVVAQGHDNSALLSTGLIATQLTWVDLQPIKEKELKIIVKTLKNSTKNDFYRRLHCWSLKHQDFLNERSEKPNEKGYFPYKHRNVRGAYASLKRYENYLFTFEKYPELAIEKTTNRLEGLFGELKRYLSNHNGLIKRRKVLFI